MILLTATIAKSREAHVILDPGQKAPYYGVLIDESSYRNMFFIDQSLKECEASVKYLENSDCECDTSLFGPAETIGLGLVLGALVGGIAMSSFR
jgi:hypothetical protein